MSEDKNMVSRRSVLKGAAAGGVGLAAIQFARWKGARVVATSSELKKEFLLIPKEKVNDFALPRLIDKYWNSYLKNDDI